MKTLLDKQRLIILLILIASLFACSSDDDNSPQPSIPELLANKWFFVEQIDTSTNPPSVNVFDDCEKNGYFNFIIDGTFVAESFYQNLDLDCESNGVLAANYVFSADGQKVIITDAMNTLSITYDIESITSTNLTLYDINFPTLKSKFER